MQWDETKTSGKLAYQEVFVEVTIYGESRTTDECAAFVGCCFRIKKNSRIAKIGLGKNRLKNHNAYKLLIK